MSITHEDRVLAAGQAIETLNRLGHPDLADVLRIEWNETFTSRLGDALYKRSGVCSLDSLAALRGARHGSRGFDAAVRRVNAEMASGQERGAQARVRFSIPLWPRASVQERYETVVHEICHIVANHEAALAGRPRPQAHGHEWKRLMWKAGVEPKRCHNVDRTGLAKTNKVIDASCGCGKHDVTPYVAGRIAAGCRYTCRKCKQAIVVHEKVAPVAKKGGGRRRRRGFRF